MKNLFHFSFLAAFSIALLFSNLKAQSKMWENYIAGGKKFTAIAEENNFIWVGTDIGLIRVNKSSNELLFYDKSTGLPDNYITAIAIDDSGNKWIGLAGLSGAVGFGLAKFDGVNWAYFNTGNSPLPSDQIAALFIDKEKNLWIGCTSEYPYLVKYYMGNWVIYDINNSALPNRVITSITEDSSSIWIGTHGGLVKFDGINWRLYNPQNSDIPSGIINDIAVDNANKKWIGMFGGLAVFNDSVWVAYNQDTLFNEINDISIDKNGNFWLGTYNGLIKFDLNNWTIYDKENSAIPADEVDVLLIDRDNYKWLGT
ncbi:MAG TPA: two-component regulator propeller domain-containing protein, partial [Ignavibacteriaceae bacterium]|nr:two-component regulator propeller domain-containing protein [Ignavibacteriaceae bacterium]